MQYIAIVIITIFSLISGAIGYIIKDSTPPVIVYRDNECLDTENKKSLDDSLDEYPSKELTELSIKLSNAETKLNNCFNDYANNCYRETGITTEEITKIQEDCLKSTTEKNTEMQQLRVENNNLMKKADDCREAEKRLREEYEEYKAKYNNLF